MKSILFGSTVLAATLVLLAGAGAAPQGVSVRADSARRAPVIVELFTSEGCSSCPPADALLVRLDQGQPVPEAEIIALGLHVDYWDHQGWKDRFSSAELTLRQAGYGQIFGLDSVYTPQMVVDGQVQFNGSDTEKARRAIARAALSPKAAVHLALAEKTADDRPHHVPLVVRVDSLPGVRAGETAEVLLAITENNLASDVRAGENAGRRITHAAVVRHFSTLGRAEPTRDTSFSARHVVKLDPKWDPQNLRAAVFVQERAGRRILGAAALRLARE